MDSPRRRVAPDVQQRDLEQHVRIYVGIAVGFDAVFELGPELVDQSQLIVVFVVGLEVDGLGALDREAVAPDEDRRAIGPAALLFVETGVAGLVLIDGREHGRLHFLQTVDIGVEIADGLQKQRMAKGRSQDLDSHTAVPCRNRCTKPPLRPGMNPRAKTVEDG